MKMDLYRLAQSVSLGTFNLYYWGSTYETHLQKLKTVINSLF